MSPTRKLNVQTAAVTKSLFQDGLLSQIKKTMFEMNPVADPKPRVTNIRKNNTENN